MENIFQGLNVRPCPQTLLLDFNRKFSFQNKRVLEIGSDLTLQTAQAILRMGATEVIAVNPYFPPSVNSTSSQITPICATGEDLYDIEDKSVDVVWGCAILEHIANLEPFINQTIRLLRDDGIYFLQGSPLWTAHDGHHTWFTHPGGRSYKFSENGNPYLPWEHLCLDSPEKIFISLANKNIPEQDIDSLINELLYSDSISRKTPTEIINVFSRYKDFSMSVKRGYTTLPQNIFYKEALKKFSDEDLNTRYLHIIMKKMS